MEQGGQYVHQVSTRQVHVEFVRFFVRNWLRGKGAVEDLFGLEVNSMFGKR